MFQASQDELVTPMREPLASLNLERVRGKNCVSGDFVLFGVPQSYVISAHLPSDF